MRVFVTGGTGAIGGHVIPVLVGRGHTVTALARTPEKAAAVRRQGARAVTVSLFDRSALATAFAGHDAPTWLRPSLPWRISCVPGPGETTPGFARKAQPLSPVPHATRVSAV